jgi:hypothetical protein
MKPPLSEKLVVACAKNPVFVVFVLVFAIAGLTIYVAGQIAKTSPHSFPWFVGLSVVVLIYSALMSILAIRCWGVAENADV